MGMGLNTEASEGGGWAHDVWKGLVAALNGGTFPPLNNGAFSPAEEKADELLKLTIRRGILLSDDVEETIATILEQDKS